MQQYLIYSTNNSINSKLPNWHGAEFGKDFKSACDKLAVKNENFKRYYNPETLTYNGYSLYPSYTKTLDKMKIK